MATHAIRVSAGLEIGERPTTAVGIAARLAFPTALLVGIAAIGSILTPATYARETASWAAQGLGQDWVNLVVVVPVLVVSATFAMLGSNKATLVLGGALFYTVYSFLIYAFAVHFNWLFLVYCGALGFSTFAVVLLVARFDGTPRRALPVRTVAGTLLAIATMFGSMWLAQVLPALANGVDPAGLGEVGLATNPVHVLDLSLVLPALVVIAVGLLRRRRFAQVLAPIALAFSALMTFAIDGMIAMMYVRGLAIDAGPSIAMGVVGVWCAALLGVVLRRW